MTPPRAPPLTYERPPPSRCLWNYEEHSLPPSLGGVLQRPSPVGLSSFPRNPRLDAHHLWSGTAGWPWLQEEAVSSANLEGCVCWGHTVGQTPSPGLELQGPRDPRRRQPPPAVWRESGLPPAYLTLGKALPSPDCGARELDFSTWLAGHGTCSSFEDPAAPGLHPGVAQVSGCHFRL